jgi:hypothetical protein
MTTLTTERAALAMIAALVGACSTDVRQSEANHGVPDAGTDATNCFPPVAPDAGNAARYECSSDVTRPTEWRRPEVCGAAMNPGCPWRFGCGSFDVARDEIRGACHAGNIQPFEARDRGLLVIGDFDGAVYGLVRVYYDEATHEMLGFAETDDVGTLVCSGHVPKWGQETDVVPLCATDGGALFDAGTGGYPTDAGDSG